MSRALRGERGRSAGGELVVVVVGSVGHKCGRALSSYSRARWGERTPPEFVCEGEGDGECEAAGGNQMLGAQLSPCRSVQYSPVQHGARIYCTVYYMHTIRTATFPLSTAW
jgi:hypothetical protein